MVKQWSTWSCGFEVTCSNSWRSDCSSLLFFLFCFSPAKALFFVNDHTTKLGMKDLLKDQQWRVERDSNLIPPQYRPNALAATPCSRFTKVISSTSEKVQHLIKFHGCVSSDFYPSLRDLHCKCSFEALADFIFSQLGSKNWTKWSYGVIMIRFPDGS